MLFEKEKIIDETLLEEPFDSLRVELRDLDVEIKAGEDYEIHYSGKASEKPTVELDNDVAVIKQPKKKAIRGIYVSVNFSEEKLTITIPNDKVHTLKNTKITTASGDVVISGIIGNDLKINLASGNLKINDVFLENAQVNVASGDIDIDQLEIMNLQVKTASGDINIEDSKFWGTAELVAVSGDSTVSTTRFRTYNLKTVSGENRLFDKVSSKPIQQGQGQNPELKMSAVSGDNTVR